MPVRTSSAEDEAKALLANGVYVVAEGANMPSEPGAVRQFVDAGILYGPGKAANAGGVAVSGLEMVQNATFSTWNRDQVDVRLLGIMVDIHDSCVRAAAEYGQPGNYVVGRQHRRLRESRLGHAGPGRRVDRRLT